MLKGWPTSIKWENIEARILNMADPLRTLIEGPGARHQCVFWKETMQIVRKNGSGSVSRIEGQFADFEKTRPG